MCLFEIFNYFLGYIVNKRAQFRFSCPAVDFYRVPLPWRRGRRRDGMVTQNRDKKTS